MAEVRKRNYDTGKVESRPIYYATSYEGRRPHEDPIIGESVYGNMLTYKNHVLADVFAPTEKKIIVKNCYTYAGQSQEALNYQNVTGPFSHECVLGSSYTKNWNYGAIYPDAFLHGGWRADTDSVKRYHNDVWSATQNNSQWSAYENWFNPFENEYQCFLDKEYVGDTSDNEIYLDNVVSYASFEVPVLMSKWHVNGRDWFTEPWVRKNNMPDVYVTSMRNYLDELDNYGETETAYYGLMVYHTQPIWFGHESIISGEGLTDYVENNHTTTNYDGPNGWIALAIKGTKYDGSFNPTYSQGYIKMYDLKTEAVKLATDVYYLKDEHYLKCDNNAAEPFTNENNRTFIGLAYWTQPDYYKSMHLKSYATSGIAVRRKYAGIDPVVGFYTGGASALADVRQGAQGYTNIYPDFTQAYPDADTNGWYNDQGQWVQTPLTIDERMAYLAKFYPPSEYRIEKFKNNKEADNLRHVIPMFNSTKNSYWCPPFNTLARNFIITPVE